MRIVIALGGNALLDPGRSPEAEAQRHSIDIAAAAIAELAPSHDIVVTHGNGPQVGLLAMQAEAFESVRPYPLDVLGAQSEGMIGYLIEQGLRNRLPGRQVVTLLTQTEVNPDDEAFSLPTKPIGQRYSEDQARRLEAQRGWTMAPEDGGYRRVVASPEPLRIIELPALKLLIEAGAIVICAGGGGIPVIVSDAGALCGVEAVVDKDLSAVLLATELAADALLLLTNVEAVFLGWDTERPQALRNATPHELRRHHFAPGSMAPKVEAACRFVEQTGGMAAIGSLEQASALLAGKAGTMVRR